MGSIRDAASTSSASSSSSPTRQGRGNSSATDHRTSKRRTRHQSPSVASLRSRFERLQWPRPGDGRAPATGKRPPAGAPNRRGGTGEATSGLSNIAAEPVEDRRWKGQLSTTTAHPIAASRSSAAGRSHGAESTQAAVNRERPVTAAVSTRNQQPELKKPQRDDQGNLYFTVSVYTRMH